MVRFVRVALVWWAVAAAAATVAVGFFTELVTSDERPWWVIVAFALSVAAFVGLSGWAVALGVRDRHDELARRRAEVLAPFTDVPSEVAGRHTAVSLLDPLAGLGPFVGRRNEVDALRAWCTSAGADRIRVLHGDSGVGKTRLARQVARALPSGWASGVVVADRANDVIAASAACGDATLVVVDDADTVPGTPALMSAALRHGEPPLIKVLLLVRDATTFMGWLAQRGPDELAREWPDTRVEIAGADGDRKRWFAQMFTAYRAALTDSDPAGPADFGPVGRTNEPMIVTCARAALAAVAGGRPDDIEAVRTVSTAELAVLLVRNEQQRWTATASDPKWSLPGSGLTSALLAKVVLALVLAAPITEPDAVAVLRRLPDLVDQPAAVLFAFLKWAQHLYPPPAASGTVLVAPRPDFVAAALVVRCTADEYADVRTAVLGVESGVQTSALVGIIRAAEWFPDAVTLLAPVLEHTPAAVASAIEAAALAGADARKAALRFLIDALAAAELADDTIDRLFVITDSPGLQRLRVELYRIVVERWRRAAADANPGDEAATSLASALTGFGDRLREVGEYRQALDAHREVVGLGRDVARDDPARYNPDLANALSNLGASLNDIGEHRQALDAHREAVGLWRDAGRDNPARHNPDLAIALNNLASILSTVDDHAGAIRIRTEAVAWWLRLAQHTPEFHGRYRAALTDLTREFATAGHDIDAARTAVEAAARDLPPPQ